MEVRDIPKAIDVYDEFQIAPGRVIKYVSAFGFSRQPMIRRRYGPARAMKQPIASTPGLSVSARIPFCQTLNRMSHYVIHMHGNSVIYVQKYYQRNTILPVVNGAGFPLSFYQLYGMLYYFICRLCL